MNRLKEGRPIAAKFGGSSMADAERIKKVAEIVCSNNDRRFVVVSAPGKRHNGDEKITDLFLSCNAAAEEGKKFDENFGRISQRFEDIGRGLGNHTSVIGWLDTVYNGINSHKGRDWSASRGEWLM